ncbi:MAG: acyl-CoA thioesterase, partial [Ruminococcus sp.]|nr:acyl-CoA thioesterase [Ruminococcus sp.]
VEEARFKWLEENVMNYNEFEKLGCIIPATSASENFLNYLRFDDPFKVEVKLESYKGIKMTFSYKIYNENDGSLCYTGESSHFFAKEEGKEQYLPYLSFRRDFPKEHKKLLALSKS